MKKRGSILKTIREKIAKGFKKGFEMSSKKDLPPALDLRNVEERLKDLEEGKICFFTDVEIPVLKCSEKYSEWVVLGLPKNYKVFARGHVFGNSGSYLKRFENV